MALSAFEGRATPPTEQALAEALGVLGERACAAARAARLPASILTLIAEAPRYAEGRGIRIPVKTARDASDVGRLAAIKLAH